MHPFELKEEGDVRKETTAAALRKPLRLENKSSDRGSIVYTDPSNYNRHWGQESYAELENNLKKKKKRYKKNNKQSFSFYGFSHGILCHTN